VRDRVQALISTVNLDAAGAENLIRPGHDHFDHWDEIRRGDVRSDPERSENPRR
jgi:hypothetical protein